jgi:hypothetical protein
VEVIFKPIVNKNGFFEEMLMGLLMLEGLNKTHK